MKIGLISDTHHEIYNHLSDYAWIADIESDQYDVIVLAGDISDASGLYDLAVDLRKKVKYVIVIHGNHECYRNTRVNVVETLTKLNELEGIYFLNNSSVELDGKVFYGGCMWTNFDRHNPISKSLAMNGINDFRVIQDMRKWQGIQEMSYQCQLFEDNAPRKIDVCISHFSPSKMSITEEYKGDPLNCYFHSSMEHMMTKHKIGVWLHGHIHTAIDYMCDQTRIVTNPKGYRFENQGKKYTAKLIEI